jgi:hypothetical protein
MSGEEIGLVPRYAPRLARYLSESLCGSRSAAPHSRSQTILALADAYEWETQCIKRAGS